MSNRLATRTRHTVRADAGAPLQPGWHTAALVALIVSVALLGVALQRAHPCGYATQASAASRALSTREKLAGVYLPSLVVELGLLAYVARVGRPTSELGGLLGEPWTSARRAIGDLALAAAGFLAIRVSEWAWAAFAHGGTNVAVAAILPHTPIERLAWAIVAVTVGFSEEVVFRGYLQKQLGAFARSPAAGVALQAILFGVAHLQQGAPAAARIALYGLGLGAMARWRRSLWPAIACHVLTDLVSGF
jgi:membrane protease YdiL (CAAX protease family)